jgi:hypothetical protein
MNKKFTSVALALGALAIGAATESVAAPVVVADTYWGGNYTTPTEVIGGSQFAISSLSAEKVGNDLKVTINTAYGDTAGTAAALGTRMGSLFIGDPSKLNLSGSDGPQYNTDTFTGDTDRFGYAFDFDVPNIDVKTGQTGSGSLWALKGDGSDVRTSFGTIFRSGQAVDVLTSGANAATDTGVNGTWSVGAGAVTFSISNFFSATNLGTSLTLAWAMSCANDIILTTVDLAGNGDPNVPLPAGAVLLMSGLAGLGVVGRRSKKA